MQDQICSPEKYSIKNSYNKNIIYLNEKNIYDKNISYWIQIYFDLMKIHFDIMEKRWYNENVLLTINLFWLNENVFWYHEKRWYNKNVLLNTKLFWLNENVFSYHVNFYFCNILATINAMATGLGYYKKLGSSYWYDK